MNTLKFLNRKHNLANSPGVKHTANRTERLTGEKIHTSNTEKSIQNFLDRYHTVLTNRTPEGQKSLDALKRMIFAEHIIKPEEIPEAYWELQKRIARER